MKRGKILLALAPERVPAGAARRIQEAGEGREVLLRSGKAEIEGCLEGVQVVAGDFPPSLTLRAPDLEWFQLWSAGADWLQKVPEAVDHPFVVTTTSGLHAAPMTEHLFGLLLAWNRRFPQAFSAQERGEWGRPRMTEVDILEGKLMLILGYGSIGERVARGAEAFGMEVVGLRRSPPEGARDPGGVRVEALSALPTLLPQADVVVNLLPLTGETRNLVDAAAFGSMKPTALYINLGRGGTTDEEAMIDSLRSGRIAGALLDVYQEEPLPPDSPLWTLDNVILTSHYAGFHPRYDEIALGIFLDNLRRWVRGEPLRNLVDKKLGY